MRDRRPCMESARHSARAGAAPTSPAHKGQVIPVTVNDTTSAVTSPSQLPSVELDPLWKHPLVIRLARVGQRLRQGGMDWAGGPGTTVVVVVFLLFCVPDIAHGGGPPELASTFQPLPRAGMLALQAGLVLPLIWRGPATAWGFASPRA